MFGNRRGFGTRRGSAFMGAAAMGFASNGAARLKCLKHASEKAISKPDKGYV